VGYIALILDLRPTELAPAFSRAVNASNFFHALATLCKFRGCAVTGDPILNEATEQVSASQLLTLLDLFPADLAHGYGFIRFDVQSSLGGVFPVGDIHTVGRTIKLHRSGFQYLLSEMLRRDWTIPSAPPDDMRCA
jgi:hypothetical protein